MAKLTYILGWLKRKKKKKSYIVEFKINAGVLPMKLFVVFLKWLSFLIVHSSFHAFPILCICFLTFDRTMYI